MVSRLVGKLDVMRHLMSGALCAMAGAAMAVAAAPRPAVAMKVRLFILPDPPWVAGVRCLAFPRAHICFLWGDPLPWTAWKRARLANPGEQAKTSRVRPAPAPAKI